MGTIESVFVALILLGALLYLYLTFKPKGNNRGSCDCGTSECKVPKPKLEKTEAER